jgi:hypothetical protein
MLATKINTTGEKTRIVTFRLASITESGSEPHALGR